MALLPTLAIVGRPNVGKSTLFNRLTRSRDALVADYPGLTRDRHYGRGRLGERSYFVVDTGGFEPVAKDGIMSEMARQAREAIAEADVIVFLVDGRAGLSPQDKRIAQQLREASAPVFLAVNKTEGMRREIVTAEFHELGLGEPVAMSAAHGENVRPIIEHILDLAGGGEDDEPALRAAAARCACPAGRGRRARRRGRRSRRPRRSPPAPAAPSRT